MKVIGHNKHVPDMPGDTRIEIICNWCSSIIEMYRNEMKTTTHLGEIAACYTCPACHKLQGPFRESFLRHNVRPRKTT